MQQHRRTYTCWVIRNKYNGVELDSCIKNRNIKSCIEDYAKSIRFENYIVKDCATNMCLWELWGPQTLDRSNLEDGLAVNWLLILFSWKKNNFIPMKEGINAGMQRANERRKEYFLLKTSGSRWMRMQRWSSWTSICSMLFTVYSTGGFYRKPYFTLVLKIHTKTSVNQDYSNLFMNCIL